MVWRDQQYHSKRPSAPQEELSTLQQCPHDGEPCYARFCAKRGCFLNQSDGSITLAEMRSFGFDPRSEDSGGKIGQSPTNRKNTRKGS